MKILKTFGFSDDSTEG